MRARSPLPRLALGALLLAGSACASAPPETAPSTELTAAPPAAPEPSAPSSPELPPAVPAEAPPQAPPPSPAVKPLEDRSVIIIDQPETPPANDLISASRAAKEQREKAPTPTTRPRITNKNLKDFAGGSVTTAQPNASPERASASAAAVAAEREEQVWRERVLDLRLRARRARDEIQRLETESAALRRSFYVEDDPYVRDTRIKPAWDRALDTLSQARRDADSLRLELARVLDEGRQAGALPGWLREGIELEHDLPPDQISEPAAIEPPLASEPREPNSPP
ncbi:MAG: hypothetical protein SF066_18655 [Thermoanaerobaculia bacterium]|nr:hypothetical protein [Thermoanaerobaculia bacterium]